MSEWGDGGNAVKVSLLVSDVHVGVGGGWGKINGTGVTGMANGVCVGVCKCWYVLSLYVCVSVLGMGVKMVVDNGCVRVLLHVVVRMSVARKGGSGKKGVSILVGRWEGGGFCPEICARGSTVKLAGDVVRCGGERG